MRPFLAFALALGLLAACSRPAPPAGRWEGVYDSNGTMVVARVEVAPAGLVRVSAPDLSGAGGTGAEERAAMRSGLAARLVNGWDEVLPRPMDFDGTIFRKPGGIAPQMIWDKATGAMMLVLYLGNQPEIHVPLHAVSDFSQEPWPSG